MKLIGIGWFFACAALAGCSGAVGAADGDSDVALDGDTATLADGGPDVALDGDAASACPSVDRAASAAGMPCAPEGAVCRYGYDRPECGGRTLTCEHGQWSEEHTDPSTSCSAEAAAPFACGDQTCEPTQVCIEDHPCINATEVDGGGLGCPPGYHFLPEHACVRVSPSYRCSTLRPGCTSPNPCLCADNPGSDGTCTTADGRSGPSPAGCI